jgi:hypothetical protein
MAVTAVKQVNELEGVLVLAPERYDPRRSPPKSGCAGGVALGALAKSVRRVVNGSTEGVSRCIVLDTSDAQEGILVNRKPPISLREIGSAKKIVEPGDVLISRLRPYLRQTAFVDHEIRHLEDGVLLLCSTEFFVLRSMDGQSIAFLAPFLLSVEVQRVLAAAQEGGHHPRFNEATLLGLALSASLLARRDEMSREVERSVKLFRQSEGILANLIRSLQ